MKLQPKVLFITTVDPRGCSTGGEIVSQSIADTLQELAEVKILCYSRNGTKNPSPFGNLVIESESNPFFVLKQLIKAIVFGRPFSVQKYYSKKARKLTIQAIKQFRPTHIFVDHLQMCWTIDLIKANTDARVCLISHNVESCVYSDLAESTKNVLKSFIYSREKRLIKELEKVVLKQVDANIVLSESDKEFYSQYNKTTRIFYSFIPFNEKLKITEDTSLLHDIVLLGSWTWKPNYDGLIWFLKEVLPNLDDNIAVKVAGRADEAIFRGIKQVEYLGFVKDSKQFLESGKVIAIPTTQGQGVQIKMIESIVVGRPIVTTSLGVRGLDNLPSFVSTLNSPEEFASKLNELVQIPNLVVSKEGIMWNSKNGQKSRQVLEGLIR